MSLGAWCCREHREVRVQELRRKPVLREQVGPSHSKNPSFGPTRGAKEFTENWRFAIANQFREFFGT
jgi:hypothetical protein